MIESKIWELLWAKSNPKKSLKAHMIETGLCTTEYLSAPSSAGMLNFLQEMWSCSKEKAIGRAAYLCSIHDIGKSSPMFQRKNEECLDAWKQAGYENMFPKLRKQNFRHEHYSAVIMKKIWTEDKEPPMDEILADAYSEILALHHQKNNGNRNDNKCSEKWEEICRELEKQMYSFFMPDDFLDCPKHVDATCLFLTGLVILSDWVASSGPFDELEENENYIENGRKIAKETLLSYGLISDDLFPKIDTFQTMWREIEMPNALQSACENLDNNALLTIIEAPMGQGKTEAALYLAGKICNVRNKRGIYMALPTQATSNQMVTRVADMLENFGIKHVRLLHGSAFMQEEDKIVQEQMPGQASEWLKPMRRALLGENAVGTVDQAMAAVLKIKFSVLRLLGLQNKVLIIDEIHAYDMYMSEVISMLLKWCCVLKIPVIMLSATLQNAQKQKYLSCYGADVLDKENLPYPLLTQVGEDGKVSYALPKIEHSFNYQWKPIRQMGNAQKIAELAMERVKNGGCLCILVNTVKHAQEVYRELRRKKSEDIEIILFHARFTIERRSEIEKLCLTKFGKQRDQRPKRAILVATQVIEQSLDIDFDGMITEIAPIDLLLQRAGRVHRHKGQKRPHGFEQPVIEVLLPMQQAEKEKENRYGLNGCVYDTFLLHNTEQMMKEECSIHIPSDMRRVIETVYNNLSEENIAAFFNRQTKQTYMKNEALSNIIDKPDKDTFFVVESNSSFDLPASFDIDDGLETKQRASTRMGEASVRVAFCGQKLFEEVQKGKISSEKLREVFKQSVLLRLPDYDPDTLIEGDGEIGKIDRGVLKGCIACKGTQECNLGKYHIFNDMELGIWWEG